MNEVIIPWEREEVDIPRNVFEQHIDSSGFDSQYPVILTFL